jgi:hypothetical protein
MAYAIGPFGAAAGVPGEVHATQLNPVGAVCQFVTTDDEFGDYIYLPGATSVVAGSWVTYNPSAGLAASTTALLTETATGPVAIATAAVDATTEYGWFLVKGYYSGARAGSNGTIVSGGGYLQAEVASGGTGLVVLGVSASTASFIFGAFSYSAQPDSDSAATGTPGADQIVVYVNYPFATKNY